jgi:hypothetical protein
MCQAQGALFDSDQAEGSSNKPHSPLYSATFPRSGMMRSGSLSVFPTLAALMSESGFSLSGGGETSWPTATSSASGESRNATSTRPENSQHHLGRTLLDEVILEGADPITVVDAPSALAEKLKQSWPSPAARDYRDPNASSLKDRTGSTAGEQLPNFIAHHVGQKGYLSPEWVEMLMGFPQGWTRAAIAPTMSRRRARRAEVATTSPTTDGPHAPESRSSNTSRRASRRNGNFADRG